jgi:uncharacterized protein (DUF58 family)
MILTPLSLLLLLVPSVLVAASAYQPTLLPWAAGVFAGVVVVATLDWWLSRSRARIEIEREVEEKLSLGAENVARLRVSNRSRLPAVLQVKDDPPAQFDTPQRRFSLCLQPFESQALTYHTRPLNRGRYVFGNLHVRGRSLLGLSWWQRSFLAAQEVAVYPNLLEIRRYEMLARSDRLQQAGFRTTRLPGQGTEFENLRDYTPDDEYRSIDWKATARKGRPITRQYELERSQTMMLLIDAGRMMSATSGEMAKLDYAVNAALMLAYVATHKDDAVGLIAFAESVKAFLPPRKGQAQVGRLTEALYDLQPVLVEPNYAEALGLLHSRARKRALIVVFTDLVDVDASRRLLAHLSALAPRHLPLLITLRDTSLQDAARQAPEETFDVYRQAMARQVLADREAALAVLRHRGVLVLDTTPERLTVDAVNQYLALKARGRL